MPLLEVIYAISSNDHSGSTNSTQVSRLPIDSGAVPRINYVYNRAKLPEYSEIVPSAARFIARYVASPVIRHQAITSETATARMSPRYLLITCTSAPRRHVKLTPQRKDL